MTRANRPFVQSFMKEEQTAALQKALQMDDTSEAIIGNLQEKTKEIRKVRPKLHLDGYGARLVANVTKVNNNK